MSDDGTGNGSRRPTPTPGFEDLFEVVSDGVYVVDAQRRLLRWNGSAEEISGWAAEEVVGRKCFDGLLRHVDAEGNLLCHTVCPLAEAMRERREGRAVIWLHHRSGHRVKVETRVVPVYDADGRVVGAVETFHRHTEEEDLSLQMAELQQQAVLDPLTGLSNRRLGETRLEQRFVDLHRHRVPFGVFIADLDHFKAVNDAHGHQIGDRVLRTTADTLRHSIRAEDLGCRWGGEEFLVIVGGPDGAAEIVAERFRALLEASDVETDHGALRVTASVGVSIATADDDSGSLIERADAALYAAKRDGRNRVVTR